MESGWVGTADGGASWAAVDGLTGSLGVGLPSADGQTLHSLGDVTSVPSKTAGYTSFNSTWATIFSVALDLPFAFSSDRRNVTVSFQGLPQPATCGTAKSVYGCPFRTSGRGAVRLADGTLVMTAIVYWGGERANPNPKLSPFSTSVVAFRSADDGFTWDFVGTVLDAAHAPASEEGPNENDVALLADGHTLLCVVRLDAGDGKVSGPYRPYVKALSTDGGRTWSAPASMGDGVGCARPRLLSLGCGAIVLAGGRLSPTNRDVRPWLNRAGDGVAWEPYSISYWHNALEPNSTLHFDAKVRDRSRAPTSTVVAASRAAAFSGERLDWTAPRLRASCPHPCLRRSTRRPRARAPPTPPSLPRATAPASWCTRATCRPRQMWASRWGSQSRRAAGGGGSRGESLFLYLVVQLCSALVGVVGVPSLPPTRSFKR